MAGIYVHIPFCKKACHYCNFHFTTSLKLKNDYLDALLKETHLRKDYLPASTRIDTIYFGGGTPSLLAVEELARILERIRENMDVSADAEITLEANPDDVDPGKAAAWKKAGINRLSLGIQSFFEEDLIWMNRAHGAEQAGRAIPCLQDVGFQNISIDLIYGLPRMSHERWLENIEKAVETGVPHLSCYALTVEPKTALDYQVRRKTTIPAEAGHQAEQFLLLMENLEAAGYEHYEISNFAKPGYRSRHNSSYWEGIPYIGLGASAHSYDGKSRQWNISNNALYIQQLQKGNYIPEKEILTQTDLVNEYIMTRLRTREGIRLIYLTEHFGRERKDQIIKKSERFIRQGLMENIESCLVLNRQGKLYADGIAAALFLDPVPV